MPNLSQNSQDPKLVALGGEIRKLRLGRGMSQEQLALAAEVDRSYLGYVERGSNNVAFLTLAKIADALGVSMSELIGHAGL